MTVLSLDVPCETVTLDLRKGQQLSGKPGFYLKLNPNHRVSVLVDDGFVLWESHAIMQYLADKTPGQNAVSPSAVRALHTKKNGPGALRERSHVNHIPQWRAPWWLGAATSKGRGVAPRLCPKPSLGHAAINRSY